MTRVGDRTKSERTKSEILDIAWDLIASRGARVSMTEIASEANISRQLLYVHFGSRGQLLIALVRRADERFCIWEAFSKAEKITDPRLCLQAVMAAWLEFVPKIRPVAIDLIRLRAEDKAARDAWNDRMSELHGFYANLMSRFEAQGALTKDLTAVQAADYIWATSSVQYWDLLVSERGWTESDASHEIERAIISRIFSG